MKLIPLAAAVAVTLSGCMSETATGPTEFVRVTDGAAFSAAVADRRLEWPDDAAIWFRLNSDGTMEGELKRGTLTGTWSFEDGYWCREFEAGGRESPFNCQLAELSGNQVSLTKDQGAGDPSVFIIK